MYQRYINCISQKYEKPVRTNYAWNRVPWDSLLSTVKPGSIVCEACKAQSATVCTCILFQVAMPVHQWTTSLCYVIVQFISHCQWHDKHDRCLPALIPQHYCNCLYTALTHHTQRAPAVTTAHVMDQILFMNDTLPPTCRHFPFHESCDPALPCIASSHVLVSSVIHNPGCCMSLINNHPNAVCMRSWNWHGNLLETTVPYTATRTCRNAEK